MKIINKRNQYTEPEDFAIGDIVLDASGDYFKINFNLCDEKDFYLESLDTDELVYASDDIASMLRNSTVSPLIRFSSEDAELILEDERNTKKKNIEKTVATDDDKAKVGDVYKYYDSDNSDGASYGMIVGNKKYALVDVSSKYRGVMTADGSFFGELKGTADDVLKCLKSRWDHVEKVDFFKGIDK